MSDKEAQHAEALKQKEKELEDLQLNFKRMQNSMKQIEKEKEEQQIECRREIEAARQECNKLQAQMNHHMTRHAEELSASVST